MVFIGSARKTIIVILRAWGVIIEVISTLVEYNVACKLVIVYLR